MPAPKPTCFVAMPITTSPEAAALYGGDIDHFTHVLDYLLIPAIEKCGYTAIRPTSIGADIIHATIIKHLEEADLVLCDISTHNPNVFFELGIRTALDRPAALIRDNQTNKLPFDTSIINTHEYDSSLSAWTLGEQIAGLVKHIAATAGRVDDQNALWQHFGLTRRAEIPASSGDPNGAKLDLILQRLDDQVQSVHIDPGVFDVLSQPARKKGPTVETLKFNEGAVMGPRDMRGVLISEYGPEHEPLLRELALAASAFDIRFRIASLSEEQIAIDFGPYVANTPVRNKLISIADSNGLKISFQHGPSRP
jgi:hypothetical protein